MRTIGIGFDHPQALAPKEQRIVVLASPLPHKRTAMVVGYLKHWQQATKFQGTIHWIGGLPQGVNLPLSLRSEHALRLDTSEYLESVARARIVIFASEYEGFGMPPVEAVLARTCPVFSSMPARQEVMGETGCPFLNNSYESFAAALDKALSVPDQELYAWAEQLLSRHNWDRVVNELLSEINTLSNR